MKNNMKNELDYITKDSQKVPKGFTDRLEELKSVVTELRNVNSNYFTLENKATELSRAFISDFKNDKVELGKIVS
jgi:hypothetical protein